MLTLRATGRIDGTDSKGAGEIVRKTWISLLAEFIMFKLIRLEVLADSISLKFLSEMKGSGDCDQFLHFFLDE